MYYVAVTSAEEYIYTTQYTGRKFRCYLNIICGILSEIVLEMFSWDVTMQTFAVGGSDAEERNPSELVWQQGD